MRTKARETLFKILFSSQFVQPVDKSFRLGLYRAGELNEDDVKYCDRVLSLIEEHSADISSLIDKKSLAFPEARLFPADRSVLFIAIAEILYCDDVPDKVAASEAANIASRYSSEKSASFISGILSAVISDKKNL
ncbi:MAG TPA: transcription antitermination protein NusB [Candidatus Coproplasma stercoripullorum]|uniref:Transcription antitermination protein NusB n=1 Tax=Candidatus Coproplasma stercoripullorum TaxID=2840751 RepID=A0A9D1AFV5_9FIRM|nr:transcription antitermination protein NusB [Candidatus Coproplasma stercoripullorum]